MANNYVTPPAIRLIVINPRGQPRHSVKAGMRKAVSHECAVFSYRKSLHLIMINAARLCLYLPLPDYVEIRTHLHSIDIYQPDSDPAHQLIIPWGPE